MAELEFEKRKIKELQRQCLHHNIFPIFLNHCLDGEPPAVYSILKPLLEEAREQLLILDNVELKNVINSLPSGLRMYLLPIHKPITEEYLRRVAEYCIAAEVQKGYSPISSVLDQEVGSEVLAKCPELERRFDDDGLLILNEDFTLLDGGIKYEEYFLHYHQFLRRGFASNPNFDFTGKLARYRQETGDKNSFRVAIDHRRIMKFEDYRSFVEMDTWFGPDFNPEKLDDPNYVGLTVVGRSYRTLLDSYPLIKTEFLWKTNEGEAIKTLEIEEISDPEKPYDKWQINRYVHSERDMSHQIFQHLDGAAKVYPSNTYKERLDENMPNNIKPAHYIKLFRIDGQIEINDWISLISMFYKGNEMVVEYFDPKLYKEKIEPRRKLMWEN